MPKKEQKHLTLVERSQISLLKARNFSYRKIGREMGIDYSVVFREISRNCDRNGRYDPQVAQDLSKIRKKSCASVPRSITPEIKDRVTSKLQDGWSPQQTSGFLRKNNIANMSCSSIYDMVWEDKANGGILHKSLRHKGRPYMKRKGVEAGRGCIPDRVDIGQRDPIVEEKTRIGDFEADLVVGANHKGFILTLVDRKSKFSLFSLIPSKTKEVVTKEIISLLKPYKKHVLTITFDNGKEFSGHKEIAKSLNAKCYFARPYHSWERGLNEHTNGLLREFIPKKTDFRTLTQEKTKDVQNKLNNRPRKVLDYKLPVDVFLECVS